MSDARDDNGMLDAEGVGEAEATYITSGGPGAVEIEGDTFSDPTDMPAGYSRKIDPRQYREVFGMLEERHGPVIKEAFSSPSVGAVLLCGGKVVARARSASEFTASEIAATEQEHGKACFVFGREDLVEECAWSPVGSHDYYPTLRTWVVDAGTDERGLVAEGVEILADFDTGNPRMPSGFYAFDDAVREEAGLGPGFPGRSAHLGRPYHYGLAIVTLGVVDETGEARACETDVRFVPDWDRSAFVLPNPARRAFVGREIMFALGLRIALDPHQQETRIEFV